MKIFILTEIINNHSGSRAPLEIGKHLAQLGHRVTILAYDTSEDIETKKELKKAGAMVIILKRHTFPLIGKYISAIPLFKHIKNNAPDIMTFSGTMPFFLVAKLTGIPIVYIYMGSQFDAFLERKIPNQRVNVVENIINKIANMYIYLIEYILINLSTKVVAISKFAALEVSKLYQRKVDSVIYLGATELKLPKIKFSKNNNHILILSVSRITSYKGFHTIIQSLKKIKSKTRVILIIAGSQPKNNYLSYLKRIGKRNVQIIIDPSDIQLATLYKYSDIYATADRYLYFGLPVTEAMNFGKPAVAFNFAAASEIISHKYTGFVAQNHEEFTYYMKKLINNISLRKKMGRLAKNRVKYLFNWKKTAKQYENVFNKILSL